MMHRMILWNVEGRSFQCLLNILKTITKNLILEYSIIQYFYNKNVYKMFQLILYIKYRNVFQMLSILLIQFILNNAM